MDGGISWWIAEGLTIITPPQAVSVPANAPAHPAGPMQPAPSFAGADNDAGDAELDAIVGRQTLHGRFSSRALFSFSERGKVECYQLWLAGHGREDAEGHAAGTRENLVVLSGWLVLDIGEETFQLRKGDAVVFGADVAHTYVNPGSEECLMNLVMTY